LGFYASYLSQEGYTVRAFEGTPGIEAISLFKPILPLDLSQPLDPALRGQVLCLEVGEHIPAAFEETVLRNLARATEDILILSWAVPGQGGLGHVNERSNEYIVAKLEALGLQYDPVASAILRGDVGTCWWFRNTLMIFRQVAGGPPPTAAVPTCEPGPAPPRTVAQRAVDWLRSRCPALRCTACGGGEWVIGELIQAPSPSGRTALPLVPVICRNCAHTTFFSAVPMGLVSPSSSIPGPS
jgi:hypothetical protein